MLLTILLPTIYVLIGIVFLVLLDSLFWGIFKEHLVDGGKAGRGIYYSKFWDWLFYRFKKPITWLMTSLPSPQKKFLIVLDTRYRILLQKPLEIFVILMIFYITGWNIFTVIGILLSHYFLSYDYLYCVFLNQTKYVKQPKEWKPSWIMYPFQIGYWLFNPNYSYTKYRNAAIIGFLLALMFPVINYFL